MTTALIGWFSFWATYWIAESLFPYDEESQKIKPSANVPVIVARNMIFSLPYSLMLWELIPNMGIYIPDSPIARFLCSILIMDAWFYFIHRLMHTRYFYFLHKQHHEFYKPYPLVAVYCSIFEALFCDVTAMGLGPALFKMQDLEIQIWMVAAALHSLKLHSSTAYGREHNIHHRKNLCNFGLLSIFDRLLGTYQ